LTDRFVDVRRSLVGGRVTTTKSTNRRRVDLSLKLTEAMRDHRTAQKARSLKAGPHRQPALFEAKDEGSHVFRSQSGKAHWADGRFEIEAYDLRILTFGLWAHADRGQPLV
jgi:hypothetical protein